MTASTNNKDVKDVKNFVWYPDSGATNHLTADPALIHNPMENFGSEWTWSRVPLPPHRKAIGCKWVFKIKQNPDGTVQSHAQQLISSLSFSFGLKQLGKLDYFLGINVKHLHDGSLHLNQSKYVKDFIERAHMHLAKTSSIPMANNYKLTKHDGQPFEDPTLYRSIVGQPLQFHWIVVKRILRYVQGTNTYGIHLKHAPSLVSLSTTTFCDVDWATGTDDRKSISGACLFLGPNSITWWSKKQNTVSKSSSEAKYRSLALATQELSWVESLLTELQLSYKTHMVLCDNLSTVIMTHNHVLHNRTKYIELDLFIVRDKIQAKTMHVNHIPSEFQTVDVLTKPLCTNKFLSLRRQLKVQEASVVQGVY
ncbi:PREDICTED: uncharacterized protein LOC109333966 [Lupinus angustifolius]|uniref:uncharacterized protein LOC109333966 n=1 Tax=Lupinus angustifolius TaxID=3871 RepID=UPI00092FB638|nr:PREDICTED: uncharacterized protein LOC109333966 [Lupinus angustifolius]